MSVRSGSGARGDVGVIVEGGGVIEGHGSGSLRAGLDPAAHAADGQAFEAGERQQRFHVVLADTARLDAVDDGGQVAVAGFLAVLVRLAHVASFAFRLKRARTPVHTRKTARARPAELSTEEGN